MPGSSVVDSAIPIADGGTGQATAQAGFDALAPATTLGDVTYFDGTHNVRLAGNTTAVPQVLTQTGTGAVSAAPVWTTPAVVSGTPGIAPQWIKFTKAYTDFSTAGGTLTLTLDTMPIRGVLHGVAMQVTTGFSGGAIGTYTIAIGITGNNGKYITGLGSTVAGTVPTFAASTTVPDCQSTSGTWVVNVTATSGGANLNAATQGAVSIWLLVAALP